MTPDEFAAAGIYCKTMHSNLFSHYSPGLCKSKDPWVSYMSFHCGTLNVWFACTCMWTSGK